MMDEHDFSYYLATFLEYGEVEQVNGAIVTALGFPSVFPKELVVFENGARGWVLNINRNTVDILIFTQEKIPVGSKIARTKKELSLPISDDVLGKTITPLGDILGSEAIKTKQVRYLVDLRPKGIKQRVRITKPFKTGTAIIDMMVPLGYGQKELILGDRKTGKTSFVLNTIKKQVKEGVIAVYCLIGKKQSDIKDIEEILEEEGIRDKVVLIATSASNLPSLIYLAPFSAMTIAEYFAEKGQNVLVILDDLYTHARHYRELSLVAKNFPGRDSYPGDIFYTHARLLERGGNFKHPKIKEVSITCLPIVETIEGDITGYIQTNLMGITDGHILFDNDIFYNGRRPAVNVQLSVTRAGRQTQSKLYRDINHELSSFFSLYEEMLDLSHFGSELTDNTSSILKRGDDLLSFFSQPRMIVLDEQVQLILFTAIWLDLLKGSEEIMQARNKLIENIKLPALQQLVSVITSAETLNQMLGIITKQKEEVIKLWQ